MLRITRNLRGIQRLSFQAQQQVRHRSGLPINTIVLFVPQQEAWIVERFGKFHQILEPGLNILPPIIDSIRYVQSLKEIAIAVPEQSAITADNVTLKIDGVLYVRVVDPYKASYGVEDAEFAITQLAQTTMRSEIGKMTLDSVFRERDILNYAIVEAINKAAEAWGIDAKRYEIRNITTPTRVQEAMQMQVEAERKKRATVLTSEGVRQAEINVAEGRKRSRILTSEAYLTEKVNEAEGEANAVLALANAKAKAIEKIAKALAQKNGHNAVSISVAEHYIDAFGKLAKEGNTILLPANTGDVTNMVAQAMTIYQKLSSHQPSQSRQSAPTAEEIAAGHSADSADTTEAHSHQSEPPWNHTASEEEEHHSEHKDTPEFPWKS